MPPRSRIVVYLAVGLVAGFLSGLFGIGGGVIIVPGLILWFEMSDVFAKGASIVGLVPNAIVSSAINLPRGHADWRASTAIGVAGAVTVIPGSIVANVIDPVLGSVLFGVFLLLVVVQLIWRTLSARGGRAAR